MAILNTLIIPDFYDHICTKYDISEINLPNYVSDKSYFIDSHLHNPYSIIVIIKDPINVGIWMNYEIAMRFYWINSFILLCARHQVCTALNHQVQTMLQWGLANVNFACRVPYDCLPRRPVLRSGQPGAQRHADSHSRKLIGRTGKPEPRGN